MHKIDLPLAISVILLSLFGLFMVYDVSSFVAFRDFADKYHYLKDQSLWLGIGMLCLFGFTAFNYKNLYTLALPLLVVALILLVLVFLPGIGVEFLGARRWIDFGLFVVQPAEFVKLAFAIYLAAWFSQKEKGRLLAFLLIISLVVGLIILEPDMGTAAIVLVEALVVYFLAGGSILHFVAMVPFIGVIGFLFITFEPYRAQRLTSFLSSNPLESSSYHVQQILIALGAGGLAGVGIGNSLQKYAYLPESTTDSIFAVVAEEIGFVGALIVILFMMIIVIRGFVIASRAPDMFGKLLAGGITTFLGAQMILNLASQVVLLPLTGVPPPFVSYGGSSLIVDLCSIGILLNISKNNN